jgi:uncharacterized SAM-binding protein YcdF (DUF218 family)/L,D-peptidoglycan transpeptidase YkuD (ErfK/YbiS/YcfS/YnhG family)
MTVAVGSTTKSGSRRGSAPQLLRTMTWSLHVMITFLAVFSLCTNRFDLWIDLRLLGGIGSILTKIAWVGTVLLVPWCAGPRLSGWQKTVWINAGFSVTWAHRLLWPTYFVIACLIVNSIYYYQMVSTGQVEHVIPVPLTGVIAVLLGAWALFTREWIRRAARMSERASAGRFVKPVAIIFAIVCTLGAGLTFGLQSYSRPPKEPVDVAVVLGNRVMPDGTASDILRDRTLVAVDLYKRGLARHLFLSGAVLRSPTGQPLRHEPLAMLNVCLENGVPESAITLDPDGVNTRATAFNAKKFMDARGYKTVVGCSDDYHLFRIAMSFKEVGVEAFTAPAVRRGWAPMDIAAVGREVVAIAVYKTDPSYRKPKEVLMSLNSPRVIVKKTAGVLEVFDEVIPGRPRTLVKTYPCITGGMSGDKAVEGDRRTPLGTFRIVFKNPKSKFHLSLGLDYPSAEDAKRGLQSGLITRQQYNTILDALQSDLTQEENQRKLWYTPLGGEIFIHGHAEGRSGTAGCVALSNPDIEELYAALPLGTEVEIRP